MNINERIKKIREDFCDDNNTLFAEKLKVSAQYASNITKEGKNVGGKVLNRLLGLFPEVNSIWLKLGEGQMLKEEIRKAISFLEKTKKTPYEISQHTGISPDLIILDYIEKKKIPTLEDAHELINYFESIGEKLIEENKIENEIKNQPVLDIRVCAGHGIGLYGDENKIIEWVNIPRFEGCFGVTIYGDSMHGKYSSGDIIFIREIKNVLEIENGQPYVIITREDRFIRLLYLENNRVTLVAYNNTQNPDGRRKYPDKSVDGDDILFLYKVVGRLERNQL